MKKSTKTIFLFHGSMTLTDILEESDIRDRLTADTDEGEALEKAREAIDVVLADDPEENRIDPDDYNLDVDKKTFSAEDRKTAVLLAEAYLEGFRDGASLEDYDGSGDAQDAFGVIV